MLVKTDNLFGPRYALAGVLDQIAIVDAVMRTTRDTTRTEVAQLAAQYAESAAWLYEDAYDLAGARYWTGRAMEWALEADDPLMLSWTLFRRSQQAVTAREAAQAIGLARAAGRDGDQLPAPMRAAILQQEAQGHALDGEESVSQRLLDQAHVYAAAEPEKAATVAVQALRIARSSGSTRTLHEIIAVGQALSGFKALTPVKVLLDRLADASG